MSVEPEGKTIPTSTMCTSIKKLLQASTIPAILLLVMLPATDVRGADVARVKTELAAESSVWVGQKLRFHIQLMSSTYFSGAPSFDLPQVPGVFIMKVAGRPVMGTETVEGESWTTQRHEFNVYAQRAGTFTIPEFEVRFGVAESFTAPPQAQRLQTEPMTFDAKLPPGAEGLSQLISTSKLEVEESWSPSVSDEELQLEVGDAITRTITLRADDVPGMALPPIMMPEPDGLAAYPKQPSLNDKENRGSLTGVRTDSVTFVCEGPGQVVLPGFVIPWWDTAAKELKRVTLGSVTVNVSEPISQVDDSQVDSVEQASTSEANRYVAAGAILIMILIGVAFWYRIPIASAIAELKSTRNESESAHFAQLRNACRTNDPIATFNALMRWLEREWKDEEAVTIDAFLERQDDPELTRQLATLQHAVVTRSKSWRGDELLAKLATARRANKKRSQVDTRLHEGALPRLNPEA